MQLTRCPVCHSRISLDQLTQDEAGRELLGLLSQLDTLAGNALVMYLGLFRPATRDLSNDRALRLAREVEAMGKGSVTLELSTAMSETVESMRLKQTEGQFKPLSNHNYLKRVLETVEVKIQTGQQLMKSPAFSIDTAPKSKAVQSIEMLKNYQASEEFPEWFVRTVCGSLAELMIIGGLDGKPAADTMTLVVERLLVELWPKRQWVQQCRFRGAKSLHRAFISYAETTKRWPTVKDILGQVSTV